MSITQHRVGVIGGGAWGTALSILANRAGSQVMLATRNPNVIHSIRERRCNEVYLPSAFIDPGIAIIERLGEVCRGDLLILAVPSHVLRSVCISISDELPANLPVMLASKGIERGSLMLMSEVAQAILPKNPIAVISGPNFADEAAKGLPTATTIACADESLWDLLTYAVGGRLFRPYMTVDTIGAQVGGAVKNVISIACGIAIGKNFGENARAALITRGFAEITRLALVKGGKYETLMGLSGLGDLILTCGSAKSRNLSFGIAIGQGRNKKEILAGRGRMATEGVLTAESVSKLAKKFDVPMPICDAVHRILYENAPVDQVIQELLERPFTSEGI
ncbi:MAG: NAD(P)-dependent glycerol-3-phosphate dehydrogenase [Pseudomonadota bacterium]|nr:NAD(P)-dependent glycerol-3-phosphate dehydrogenase [Pseudomonadota bacterium]MDE3037659.1 NAD(P)-dependent glycerol-3-phosphate dehydrogenase [Pseudomonadota bacterium]